MKKLVRIVCIVLAILLALILVGPFLIPVPPLENAVDPRQLADLDSRFTRVNGIDVHYKFAGAGEPVFVLLHGFGASVFSWREVMAPLGEHGTAIAFDRPAFGLTERPMPGEWSGTSPYAPDAQAELTVGLMDALGVDRAVLVGNSAGGTIATLTALRYPDRVEALVLVDAAIYTGGPRSTLLSSLASTPQMRRLGPLLARSIRDRGDDFLRSAWHDPSRIPPGVIEGYRVPLQVENWDRALWELVAAGGGAVDLVDRLERLAMPVLVITGDDDRIVPTEQSVRLAAEIPGAELVVIPNCGHVPQEECPAEFMAAMRAFMGW